MRYVILGLVLALAGCSAEQEDAFIRVHEALVGTAVQGVGAYARGYAAASAQHGAGYVYVNGEPVFVSY